MKQVVIEEKKQTVTLNEISDNKIYVTKDCFGKWCKASYVNGSYRFCNLNNSIAGDCTAVSLEKSILDAFEEKYPVYEFDTLKEFAEWLVKECK